MTKIDISNHTWTGGEHYWIRFEAGACAVRRETPACHSDNETVFRGDHKACLEWLENTKRENAEIDHDI